MCRISETPNLENCNKLELQLAIKLAPSKKSHKWLQVIHFFSIGLNYEQVCSALYLSQRQLRRIIQLFNARGIDGLIEKKYRGRPKKLLPEEQSKVVQEFKEAQSNGCACSVRRFHGSLKGALKVEVSYNTVLRLIKEKGFSLQVPRPWPIGQDEEKRQDFKEKLAVLLEDPNTEIWFGDEVAFEGNPKPKRGWHKKGSKPKIGKHSKRVRSNLCGMVKPKTGEFFALEFPYIDQYTFQCFLDEANKLIASSRKQQILILDNASWHHAKNLQWGKIKPFYLPPYSPDLNPIERAWLVIKGRFFNSFVTNEIEELLNRVSMAIKHFTESKSEVASVCAIAV